MVICLFMLSTSSWVNFSKLYFLKKSFALHGFSKLVVQILHRILFVIQKNFPHLCGALNTLYVSFLFCLVSLNVISQLFNLRVHQKPTTFCLSLVWVWNSNLLFPLQQSFPEMRWLLQHPSHPTLPWVFMNLLFKSAFLVISWNFGGRKQTLVLKITYEFSPLCVFLTD